MDNRWLHHENLQQIWQSFLPNECKDEKHKTDPCQKAEFFLFDKECRKIPEPTWFKANVLRSKLEPHVLSAMQSIASHISEVDTSDNSIKKIEFATENLMEICATAVLCDRTHSAARMEYASNFLGDSVANVGYIMTALGASAVLSSPHGARAAVNMISSEFMKKDMTLESFMQSITSNLKDFVFGDEQAPGAQNLSQESTTSNTATPQTQTAETPSSPVQDMELLSVDKPTTMHPVQLEDAPAEVTPSQQQQSQSTSSSTVLTLETVPVAPAAAAPAPAPEAPTAVVASAPSSAVSK